MTLILTLLSEWHLVHLWPGYTLSFGRYPVKKEKCEWESSIVSMDITETQLFTISYIVEFTSDICLPHTYSYSM